MKSTSKKGRPQAYHRTSWGDRIDGLALLSDGRWKVAGPKPFKFTEPDERLAVARFRKIMAERHGSDVVMVEVGNANVHDIAPVYREAVKQKVTIRIPRDFTKGVTVERGFDTTEVWGWLREQVLTRPKWVAERIGIEEIGYLTTLKKPEESPTMDAMMDRYAAKTDITPEEITRCRRIWEEFVKIVGIKTIGELTQEKVEAYELKVGAMELSPKSVKHRYTRIKTVIAHSLKKQKGAEYCQTALNLLKILEVTTPDSLDPDPISPRDFWAVHAEAVKAGDKVFAAMMLFSLNCSLYPSEAGAVRWDDIDLERGEFAARRNKTGVPRIGVLWPETVAALKELPRDRETVFNTSRQAYQRYSVFREWEKYRTAAKRKSVKYAQIRDASFTTACRVSLDQARVLSGHRLPGSVDAYVLRQPQFVAAACAGIRAEFYPAEMKTKGATK